MPVLTGAVHRVTYQNRDNGYAVLKVKLSPSTDPSLFDVETDPDETITATGDLTMLHEGEQVKLQGNWKNHAKYGRYLDVKQYEVLVPTTLIGLKKFLASDHFKGIGDTLAERMVDTFGEDLPNVIEKNPHQLTQISGITRELAKTIRTAWEAARSQREDLIALQGMGLTPLMAQKVLQRYARDAAKKVQENPYRLAQELWGVGFTRADEIARNIGFTLNSPDRLRAGIEYTLTQAIDDGHMFLPQHELIEQAQKILNVNQEDVAAEVSQMLSVGALILDKTVADEAIYLPRYYEQEKLLAVRLRQLLNIKPEKSAMANLKPSEIVTALKEIQEQGHTILAPEQESAVKTFCTRSVSVLTGGPGTGKSTAINTVVKMLRKFGKSFALTAPTGRAAKRMTEITGIEASTLHRLLKLQPGDVSKYDEHTPLPFDAIIIDEVSMLDVYMALKLVSAVGPGTHLLLVGDSDQLPSVQAGNVLADIIRSDVFPVTHLKTIFRQAENSAIVQNAHRIKDGEFPKLLPHPTDFYLFPADTDEDTGRQIIEIATERIPKQFNFDPMRDVQILSPLYKTRSGVAELNTNMQQVLNPLRRGSIELKTGFQTFREGDRVMQVRNNYDKEVFNGEVGRIKQIMKSTGGAHLIAVQFDENSSNSGRTVQYTEDELREITLAYAVSVHKSQGSEYPVVIMPVTTSHYIMLQRNLLYTAVTRAKKLVVLVGSKRALFIALANDKPQLRYSGLKERLLGK